MTTSSLQSLAAALLATERKQETWYRLGIQGKPGTGKTTGVCRTFPSLRVIDFDDKLPSNMDRWPFCDKGWVKSNFPKEDHSVLVNTRDSILSFLRKQVSTIPEGGTLLLDSWTMLSIEFDIVGAAYPAAYQNADGGSSGARRKFYEHKLKYSAEILQLLKSYRGHVVVTFHEQTERNEQGIAIGTKPVASGQMADQMGAFFTSFFRSKVLPNPDDPLAPYYVWQVVSDKEFTAIRPPDFDLKKIQPIKLEKTVEKGCIFQTFDALNQCTGRKIS